MMASRSNRHAQWRNNQGPDKRLMQLRFGRLRTAVMTEMELRADLRASLPRPEQVTCPGRLFPRATPTDEAAEFARTPRATGE